MKRKLTARVQIKLRCREELRRKIEKAARKRDCSLNREINDRLERSYEYETSDRGLR